MWKQISEITDKQVVFSFQQVPSAGVPLQTHREQGKVQGQQNTDSASKQL